MLDHEQQTVTLIKTRYDSQNATLMAVHYYKNTQRVLLIKKNTAMNMLKQFYYY